jgi:hypothetical protein
MLSGARARASLVAALVLLAPVVGACELVFPIDAYEGAGAADASPTDGSAGEVGSDVGGDVGRETGPDAFAPDTGSDAGDWCANQQPGYLLCSDFDLLDGGVTQGFDPDLAYVGDGGAFVFDTTYFASPPRSARGVAAGFPEGGTAGVQLNGDLWGLEATPASVTCSLEWWPIVSQVPGGGTYSHILFLTFYSDADGSTPLRGIGLSVLGDGTIQFLDNMDSDPDADTTNNLGTLAEDAGAFTHVEISLTNGGGQTSYAVVVGSVTGAGALTVPLPATSRATILVGPAYYGALDATNPTAPSWSFDYDNVVCRTDADGG